MQFMMDSPDTGVVELFGYRDAYNFLSNVLDGTVDGPQIPANIRLTVGDKTARIFAHGEVQPKADEMMRRLWSKPEGERTWAYARKVSWHSASRSLTVVF